MGKKYASIHVFDIEQDKTLSALVEYYNKDNSMESTINQALNVFNNPKAYEMLERLAQLYKNEILIIQSKTFISIYDESISFEIVEEKVEVLSNIIDKPIIYTSNFDEDVFFFGVYCTGKLVTRGKVGNGLSCYDITPEVLNIDKFCHALSIKRSDSMDCFIILEEIDEIEKELEYIMRVPLRLTWGDVKQENERFIKKYEEKNIHVFNMN